jgi:hypothetical protein
MAMVVDAVSGFIGFVGDVIDSFMPQAPDIDVPTVDFEKLPAAKSPTYSGKIRQNIARVGGAIPHVFGTVKFFPDSVISPYSAYIHGGEFTYYILSLGYGNLSNVELFVGNSELLGFKGVDYEIIEGQAGSSTGFDFSLGSFISPVVIPPPGYLAFPSYYLWPYDRVFTCVDKIAGVKGVKLQRNDGNDGVYGEYRFDAAIIAGDSVLVVNFLASQGVTTPGPVGAQVNFNIKIVVYNDGASYVFKDEVFWVAGSSNNQPIYMGNVSDLVLVVGDVVGVTITRQTVDFSVATNGAVDTIFLGDVWLSRPYLSTNEVWRVPLRIKANAELAKAAETKIMAKVTHDGVGTVRQAVEYIWDVAGLNAFDLDASALDSADVTQINGILDTQSGIHDVLKRITAIARAYPVRSASGAVSFFVDRARASIATFDESNIVKDSLRVKMQFLQSSDSDGIKVRWFDADTMLEQFATYPAVASQSKQVDLFGCTDGAVALAHAMFLFKKRLYQNKTISWSVELAGHAISVGDVVTVIDSARGVNAMVVVGSVSPKGQMVALSGVNYDVRVYQ